MANVLVWDAAGTRKFENGVRNAVLYPMADTAYSASQYEKGVAWNGITGMTETPDGAEPNDLYADDVKYATLRSAETFGGTIEAYTYPDEFNQCDGSASPVSGLYFGQQSRKAFGLCYRTNVGDDKAYDADDKWYKLHLIYNATASPSERSFETINDSPDAITFSWEYTCTPVTVGTIDDVSYKPVSTITIDTTKFANGADDTKFKLLLDYLYGVKGETSTGDTDPQLPSAEDVVKILKGTITSAPSKLTASD